MDNHTEFRRAARALLDNLDSEKNINASVFETNIRVVGGLISAHLLSRRAGFEVEPSWPCSGALLRQAEVFASKLLPAFDTPTGMPYGTVNFKLGGVPTDETTVTCVAGVGTFILEFGALSRLTGDPRYEAAAMRALKALWKYRSTLGLPGNHIDISTGSWTARDATIGSGMPCFEVLTGDLDAARRHLTAYHEIWRQYGFLPELYSLTEEKAYRGREAYPLRPELIESILHVYRATRDPALIDMGVDILTSIEVSARTSCGFATIADVTKHTLEDRMESFFLAETTKYLYLLFDENNFIHQLPGEQTLTGSSRSPAGLQCYPESGGYIFNTEAHPIDPGALNCCSASRLDEIEQATKVKTLISDSTQYKLLMDNNNKRESDKEVNKASQQNVDSAVEIDLLSAVDSVFSEHIQSQFGISSDDAFSWAVNQTASNCFNNALFDSSLIHSWKEFRKIIESSSSSSLLQDDKQQKSSNVNSFTSKTSPLLTCPYPSFQNRFAYSGILTTT
ncbi:unnamed protein product [Trichobilharzia szidati]|nr:unnamed protein product [Trichobilharzia szidati]